MSTDTVDALALQRTNRQSNRGARAKPGKTAITLLLFGAVLVGTGVMTWSRLRAEFKKTFDGLSPCPIVTADRATLHGPEGNRVNA